MSFFFFMPSGSSSGGGGGGGNSSDVQYLIPMGQKIPAEPVYLTEGDSAGKLVYQLRDTATGAPVLVPEDATVTFRLRKIGETGLAINAAGAVEWGSQGWVSFEFSADPDVPEEGSYEAVFIVNGVTFPTLTHGSPIPVRIAGALA